MYQDFETSTLLGENGPGVGAYTGGRIPSGPPAHSWDNLAPFWGDFMHTHLSRMADTYGKVFQLRGADQSLVVLNGLEAVREALIDKDALFNDRVDFAVLKKEPQCHFLELKSGEPWERHRAIFVDSMQSYFSGRWSEVESWLQVEVQDLVRDIKQKAGRAFDPNRALALANLGFIKRMMFGERCNDWDRANFHESSVTVIPGGFMNANNESVVPAPLRPLFKAMRQRSIAGFEESINGLSNFIAKYVMERRQAAPRAEPRDLCDYLLAAEQGISERERKAYQLGGEDVVNGSLTQFAGAGTGVPTFVLRWAMVYLAQYPEVQRRLQDEMRDRLKAPPTLADRSKLPYCQAFVNEVLRHAPITPIPAAQYKAKDNTTIGGYVIEQGSPVIINYYSLTRDPAIWDEPERFEPDRFIAADGRLRKDLQTKFFPFGLGSRRCIGEHIGRMQMYLLCANLVYHFTLSPPEGQAFDVGAYPGVFMVPKPFQIVATPR